MNGLNGKYFIKKTLGGEWEDVTTKFDGVKILSIGGLNEQGKPTNIFTQQWLTEATQAEDYMIGTRDDHDNPYVIKENVDIEITFVVGARYSTNIIDVRTQHDAFVKYMSSGALYVKSAYADKEVRCVCLESYKPTLERLKRGGDSFIMGTIKLHTLDTPTATQEEILGDIYIGFGSATIAYEDEITSLVNVQHYNKASAQGAYTIVCPSTYYLWICVKGGTISKVEANGFDIPMQDVVNIGEYRCYRTSNAIIAHTMNFDIDKE